MVVFNLGGGAGTFMGLVAVKPARTRVHSGDEHEVGREGRTAFGPGEGNLTIL